MSDWLAHHASNLYTGWTWLAYRGWCPCTVFGGRLPGGSWLCRWFTGPLYRFWSSRFYPPQY